MNWKDIYYQRPVLYDYVISMIIILLLGSLTYFDKIDIPASSKSVEFSSDIGAIGLTISGFLLTLLTILVTFKSGQILANEDLNNNSSPFKIFLASPLYHRAINILKFGVLSLVCISLSLYTTKLFLASDFLVYIFYQNLTGIIIILTTFLRCFYVLGLIMKMQRA